ncbi:MAG TPA: TIGR01244 family phosphatase [Rhizobiales bacterium]|nr:TIGR01244 family phosphatase [Hyphomicrobiales bacterium]
MNLGQIEDGVFIAPQLMTGQIEQLAAQGIKTIVNNRPDGERGFYPASAEVAKVAAEHGIAYHYIPVDLSGLSMEPVKALAKVLQEAEEPVLLYCASGQRSSTIWALASAGRLSADEIISAGAAIGYNFAPMRPLLTQMAQAA